MAKLNRSGEEATRSFSVLANGPSREGGPNLSDVGLFDITMLKKAPRKRGPHP